MNEQKQEDQIANLLKVMGVPFRIELLYTLEGTEACVCHLEYLTGKRQAYISQHLRGLKEAGLVSTRREGKFIYYKVIDPEIYTLLASVEDMLGFSTSPARDYTVDPESKCTCPKCAERTG